ncbi:MAG: acyloxyacyl hydrolase [Bacteroidota bacterium]
MKQLLTYFFLFVFLSNFAQNTDSEQKSVIVFTPELLLGITAEANENFVEHGLQSGAIINFGWEQDYNTQEWAQRLKGPKTGISLGIADYGNLDSLGISLTVMPFIEFNAFRSKRFKVQSGMGLSYFNKIFDPITNPNNKGITTDLAWSFRLFMHYQFLSSQKMDWRAGIGYYHHSNGHTRLPNQGLNSFLFSVSADIKNPVKIQLAKDSFVKPEFKKTVYDYASLRTGYGINVLGEAEVFNESKGVYTLAGEYGKVFNHTFKLGVGFFYRYYEHYHDYIKNNESLVQEGQELARLKDSPFYNGSAHGLFITGEVLLNHVGIEAYLGANLHKPAYQIDWQMNEGWDNTPREIPPNWVLGELDSKYKKKKLISSRLGLKYYLLGTRRVPKHNVYAAFHINTNLGQADFTEFSLAYVYSFRSRER